METVNFFKISVYIPESHLEVVKEALFNAGAGKQGNYDKACWQCIGQGQFRPLKGANPAIGELQQLNFVVEYKVEMLCSELCLNSAIKALISSHPYEEPSYDIVKLENSYPVSIAR